MNQSKGLVFISCGQRTEEEKKLGQEIVQLVRDLTPYEPYFAEFQQSLDGLTKNIFENLNRMVGFITVMHKRGEVSFNGKVQFSRGSVWVEQEIGIASFITQSLGRHIEPLSFIEEGIELEGVRQYTIMNPIRFKRNDEIIEHLKDRLPAWKLSFPSVHRTQEGEQLSGIISRIRNDSLLKVLSVKEWGLLWMLGIPNPPFPKDERLFNTLDIKKSWMQDVALVYIPDSEPKILRYGLEMLWSRGNEVYGQILFETNGCFSSFQQLDNKKEYHNGHKLIHAGHICHELHKFLRLVGRCYDHHIHSVDELTIQLRLEYCQDYAFVYPGLNMDDHRTIKTSMISKEKHIEPFQRTAHIGEVLQQPKKITREIITEVYQTFGLEKPEGCFKEDGEFAF